MNQNEQWNPTGPQHGEEIPPLGKGQFFIEGHISSADGTVHTEGYYKQQQEEDDERRRIHVEEATLSEAAADAQEALETIAEIPQFIAALQRDYPEWASAQITPKYNDGAQGQGIYIVGYQVTLPISVKVPHSGMRKILGTQSMVGEMRLDITYTPRTVTTPTLRNPGDWDRLFKDKHGYPFSVVRDRSIYLNTEALFTINGEIEKLGCNPSKSQANEWITGIVNLTEEQYNLDFGWNSPQSIDGSDVRRQIALYMEGIGEGLLEQLAKLPERITALQTYKREQQRMRG